MITKKQKAINKKQRYLKTKAFARKQERKIIKEKDLNWSWEVKTRDNFSCIICKSKDKINAHHIIPRCNKTFRWDVDNGVSLCSKHHRFSMELSAHHNPFIFYKFLEQVRFNQLINLYDKYKKLKETQDGTTNQKIL